jgi:hypothetical protein
MSLSRRIPSEGISSREGGRGSKSKLVFCIALSGDAGRFERHLRKNFLKLYEAQAHFVCPSFSVSETGPGIERQRKVHCMEQSRGDSR